MNIHEFVAQYKNHPVIFVGTGVSLRYLHNSYTWDGLLKEISFRFKGNDEFYYNLKAKCIENNVCSYAKVATLLEKEFNNYLDLEENRNGDFKEVNDIFFKNMANDIKVSKFKIYVSQLLQELDIKESLKDELNEFKKSRKNIGSVITTNYDTLIETIFDFEKLVGNDILLSNPYGSVYKIHGCVSNPNKIILTEEDYEEFNGRYELIRAQLLSLFIHNPIIFLGYSIGDNNIKHLLRTIFTYVPLNTDMADKIRKNFLLVEYLPQSQNIEITEHDIDLGNSTSIIRINKIKTDDFTSIYKAISQLSLPVSAMEIRKVQSIVKDIYSGGDIQVQIAEDIESLKNQDKVLAIGSKKTINVIFQTVPEIISNYFKIIEEDNSKILETLEKQTIRDGQWFPAYAFSKIIKLEKLENLRNKQEEKLKEYISNIPVKIRTAYICIEEVNNDNAISNSHKTKALVWVIMQNNVLLEQIEQHLKNVPEKNKTDYKILLCAYDYKKYHNT